MTPAIAILMARMIQDHLPRVKSAMFRDLHAVLKCDPAADRHPEAGRGERRKIATILRATLPGWPPR